MCSLVYKGILWLTCASIDSDCGSAGMGAVRTSTPLQHRHLPFLIEEVHDRTVEFVALHLRYDLHKVSTASVVGCDFLMATPDCFSVSARPRRTGGPVRRKRARPGAPAAAPAIDGGVRGGFQETTKAFGQVRRPNRDPTAPDGTGTKPPMVCTPPLGISKVMWAMATTAVAKAML
jgi:hypothetical protein